LDNTTLNTCQPKSNASDTFPHLLLLRLVVAAVDVEDRLVLRADGTGQVVLLERVAVEVRPRGVDVAHVAQRAPERDARLHATTDADLREREAIWHSELLCETRCMTHLGQEGCGVL
jgi:hypothetical protein